MHQSALQHGCSVINSFTASLKSASLPDPFSRMNYRMKVCNKCQVLKPSARHSPNHSTANVHVCSNSLWFTGCFMWCPTCRLVIASRFHPCPVLIGLLKFLAPSRPFVVYSQYKEVSSSLVAEPQQHRWSSPTEWTLFMLERALISCHWTQAFIVQSSGGKRCYYVTAADIPVTAQELQWSSRPGTFPPLCLWC